jgi:integrase
VSPHWLRHAHGSHAIERGASLPEVQAKLGHGNIATTSGYLHARPVRPIASRESRRCSQQFAKRRSARVD